jgi:hypothetical protein
VGAVVDQEKLKLQRMQRHRRYVWVGDGVDVYFKTSEREAGEAWLRKALGLDE